MCVLIEEAAISPCTVAVERENIETDPAVWYFGLFEPPVTRSENAVS